MLISLLTAILRLTTSLRGDVAHEEAHHRCETLLYLMVAPDVQYPDTTPAGEALCSLLCRGDDPLPSL